MQSFLQRVFKYDEIIDQTHSLILNKKRMINNNSIIQQNTKLFLANNLSGEMVFMNLENGSYLGLNAIGTTIWNFIEQRINVEEIVSKLMEQYNIDQETCEKQTIELLVQMQNEEMIIVS